MTQPKISFGEQGKDVKQGPGEELEPSLLVLERC